MLERKNNMTYKEYEIIVEKLEERLDSGLITESTAEAINSYCYDKYMESYVDEMCDALEDEYDESTALSKHVRGKFLESDNKVKEIDRKLKKYQNLQKSLDENNPTYKTLQNKIDGLKQERIKASQAVKKYAQMDSKTTGKWVSDDKAAGNTAHLDSDINSGRDNKDLMKHRYNAERVTPREPGTYKKLQDKMRNEK